MLEDIFCERLDKAIRSNYYTQRELAVKIGVTESTISRYINGHSFPSLEILAKIAKRLHVTSDYLLGIDDKSKDFAYIVLWLHQNAETLTKEQIQSFVNELPKSWNADENDKTDKDAELAKLLLATTMTEIRRLLDSLSFTYEVLAPSCIRLYYPNSDDYTLISVCNGTDVAISGSIVGSVDDLKAHLVDIKFYSP